MTWKEWKKAIRAALNEAEIAEDADIAYIDCAAHEPIIIKVDGGLTGVVGVNDD